MVRANDLQEKLLHLIGWRQNYDTTELKIADSLTDSETGLYYQQVHPLLTLQNLACIAPDFKNVSFPDYEVETGYKRGNIVSVEGVLYRALADSKGKTPAESKEYWEETNPFSEWLEDKTKASIQKAITRYFNDKVADGTARPLVESKTLFDGTGRISDTVGNRNRLVGFEIIPVRSKGVTLKINKIGLQFTKLGTYTLYLMHSSQNTPVRVIHLEKKTGSSFEWFTFNDLYLPYQSDGTDAGGSWYLCYMQSELPFGSEAVRKERDWSKGPCNSCSRREYLSWQAWSKYLEIHPFYVSEEQVGIDKIGNDFNADFEHTNFDTDLRGTQPFMWDVEQNVYTYNSNYGINLEVSVGCDFTDFVIDQRAMFQDVIAKQVAVDMLREFAYNANARTNRHSINASRLDILYEVDGDSSSMKKSGLGYQLEMAFKAVKLSTEGVDRVCMPCKNNGIKYRSV